MIIFLPNAVVEEFWNANTISIHVYWAYFTPDTSTGDFQMVDFQETLKSLRTHTQRHKTL